MEKIRILVADDTPIGLEGMARVVNQAPDMETIGEARTIPQVVEKAQSLRPDIILLDLKWFGDEGAGAAIIPAISEYSPESKVIAITAHHHLIEEARQRGASAAITKDVSRTRLYEIIRDVYNTKLETTDTYIEPLTQRELDVLELMVLGMRDKEIADHLHIAESTAKNHVRSVLDKLQVTNRTQAAVAAISRGMVPDRTRNQD